MTNKMTLHFNSSEREQLQHLAALLGIKATRGAGAGSLGSVSGLVSALNDTYIDDPARTLTLLARLFQRDRPDIFGYWITGDKHFLVRWRADHTAGTHGKAQLSVITSSMEEYVPLGNGEDNLYIVPDEVTEDDLRWIDQSGARVKRASEQHAVLA